MNNEDTSGFYKLENSELFYGKNFVYGIEYTNLLRENKDSYSYPVGGWYWFDTIEQAKIFFNYKDKQNEIAPIPKPYTPNPYLTTEENLKLYENQQ
jgi:hypothetical protein